MEKEHKIWYNYWHSPYSGDEKPFFNNNAFKWAENLKNKWPVYKAELETLIKEQQQLFRPYFASQRDTGKSGWKTITLRTWGIDVSQNLQKCPELSSLIRSTPGWLSAALSLLEPNTSIQAHQGDTNAIFRCHIGIRIPSAGNDCALKVKNETKYWNEGEVLVFLDAFEHEAWNRTSENRIIMIFDILRPEFLHRQKEVCFNVRSFLLLQMLIQKIPLLIHAPKWVNRFLYLFTKMILVLIYPVQKKSGVILRQ